MAERKKRSTKPTPKNDYKFKINSGIVISNALIYSRPLDEEFSPYATCLGAVLSGEKVDIIDSKIINGCWIKVKSVTTKVEGYISYHNIM